MEPARRAYIKYLSYLIGVLLGALVILVGVVSWIEIFNLVREHTSGYPWGWEGGGWKYQSADHYLLINLFEAVLSALLVVSFILRKKHPRLLIALLLLFTLTWVMEYLVT